MINGRSSLIILLCQVLILSSVFCLIFSKDALAEEVFPQLVSIASDGSQGSEISENASSSLSADGRYVAFESYAPNFVPNDTNAVQDAFVRDRFLGTTERVSVASDGSEGNDGAETPALSSSGRYVVFASFASNLVPNDNNDTEDIFVRDRFLGTTERVSVASDGSEGNSRSAEYPAISSDGRYVSFKSDASNLVPNDTNTKTDVFVHDRVTGSTMRVSVSSDGNEGNGWSIIMYSSISIDGRYVVFESTATNLVPNDTNAAPDIFIHDLVAGNTQRVSVASNGSEGDAGSQSPNMSAGGRYVAFISGASNFVSGGTNNEEQTYVHDRVTGQTTLVSVSSDGNEANSWSYHPSLSADGRYVTFESDATNLSPTDINGNNADVFVHDLITGSTVRVSEAADGSQGNGESYDAALSSDGRFIMFGSTASNLVINDTNGFNDTFLTQNPLFISPSELIDDLIETTESFNLQQGISNSLDSKLQAALEALNDVNENNDQAAINTLNSFIAAVEAQRGNQITNEQADTLIEQAQAIIAQLSS